MRLIFTLALCLLCLGAAIAQKTELSVQLNSSASYFGGSSADKTTFISVSDTSPDNYLGNAYGTNAGLGYGLGVQLQRITRNNILFGAQISAEQLRSKIEIDRIIGFWINSEAEGDATLKTTFINIQPYLGWRFTSSFADIDITLGTDAGIILKSEHTGEATADNGSTYKTSGEHDDSLIDFRPKTGVTIYRGSFGVALSYAHGLTNYRDGWDGSDGELYSRVFRLGLLYRL